MNEELRALFAARCDGTITPEQLGELEGKLAASAEARRLWFGYCDMETGLADWATARAQREIPRAAARDISWSSPSFYRWLAPLAAAAAIGLGAFWWPRTPAESAQPREVAASGVAVLARAVGAEWEGAAPTSGAVLAPGTLRLNSGSVLVEFFSGARVIVEGPAELQLVSSGETVLRSGRLNAHVPPQARGFTVRARNFTLVDHGTDFGITLQPDTGPEVHVFNGNVEVSAPSLAPRMLGTGEATRLDRGVWQPIAAAREGFLAEPELIRRDAVQAGEHLSAWRAASDALGAQAVLHFTFDEADVGTRRLRNDIPASAEISHGSIVGAAWTEGRWPGKRALRFQSEADRVRFNAETPMQALTLLAWVRVDALPRWQNVLLSAESERPGALRWHLTKGGELRLEIARDLGRSKSDWDGVNSAPFVTPERFGQWLLLATTFDGATIRHYGNGELIGSGALFTPPVLLVGTAELGNWNGGTHRHLAAAVDEFVILPRALSAAEIAASVRAGK